MDDEPTLYDQLKQKVASLAADLEAITFTLWRKTGSGSGDIQGAKMQSVNFKTGVSGWALDPDGNLEANNGNFRGDITGASGTFSGTVTVGSLNIPDQTTANSMHVDSSGNTWWGANVASGYAGATAYVLNTGAALFSSVTATGILNATLGSTLFNIQVFSATGTWSKPAAANANSVVEVWVFGAGGGGGGGASGAANLSGGSGGGGGGIGWKRFLASSLGATETITIGTGGTGGAAASNGVDGGATSFGTTVYLKTNGGSKGLAGAVSADSTGGAGGVTGNGEVFAAGGAGGNGRFDDFDGNAGTDTASLPSSRGGGGGGGRNSLGNAKNGGIGGGFITNYVKAGGAVNTIGNSSIALFYGGTGGGGGNGGGGGTGTTGGAGIEGSGGGGGGAGATGGVGGTGGNGYVIVITRF